VRRGCHSACTEPAFTSRPSSLNNSTTITARTAKPDAVKSHVGHAGTLLAARCIRVTMGLPVRVSTAAAGRCPEVRKTPDWSLTIMPPPGGPAGATSPGHRPAAAQGDEKDKLIDAPPISSLKSVCNISGFRERGR
jgi:hypothetical protein